MQKKPNNEWADRARASIAQGALTNSKRPEAFVKGVFPSHVVRGEGAYLFDAWGNRYLDFCGGLGANLLGYAHPKIAEAVCKATNLGPSLSLPSVLEIEVAEKICEITGFPKIRFFKTGTEACMAAVRIARCKSDARLASPGYHGWSDQFVSLTKPAAGIVDKFNISNGEVAAYDENSWIIEPLALHMELDKTRAVNLNKIKKHPVIYDEIITGFRVPEQFVYKWWNLQPDLVCLGKGLANGYPLAAVVMGNDYAEKEWFCSGTYCGEMVSLAACKATMEVLATKKITDLWFYANRFMDSLNKILAEIDVKIQGYGTRGFLPLETLNEALFIQEACKAGLLFGKAFFFGYAHLEANIEESTLHLVGDIVTKIRTGKAKLEGDMPKSSFKRY